MDATMPYDEILQALMDKIDRERFVAEMHKAADRETGWVELDRFDWESQ